MAYLYQEIMKVPTLTGTWQQRNAQLYSKLGLSKTLGNYSGNKDQNIALLNSITSNNYYKDWATPKKTTAPTTTTPTTPTTATRTVQPVMPETPNELTTYLNQYQENLNAVNDYDALNVGSDEVNNFAEDTLGVESQMPEAPKYTEMFKTLREEYGLDNIETAIGEYKNLARNAELLLNERKNYARNQTTRMGVIEGRVDKVTQQAQEEIAWYQSNITFLTEQANAGYSLINQMINLNKMDYDTAKEVYQTEFSNRLQLWSALSTAKKDERDFKYQMIQDQQKIASTNLSIYADMITSGSMQWDKMSAEEKLEMNKLEIQSGLGLGFLSKLSVPKGNNVKQIIQRTDPNTGVAYADIIMVDPVTGKTSVVHQKLGQADLPASQKRSSSGSSSSSTKNKYGYTSSQWNTKLSDSRNYLMKLEDELNRSSTGDKGDLVLADWEVAKVEASFKAKYGDAGHELLVNALNSGGYTLYDYNTGGKLKVKWS